MRLSEVDLWALDEVRFQQYGSRCRMWVPPEVHDPVLPHFPGRRSVGYFGAVRLRDGQFVYRRETDKFNARSFWEFLQQLEGVQRKANRPMILIVDNARYHHAKLHRTWREEHDRQVRLDYLPPYSPELNPIERVWKLTRRNRLHNRYFQTLAEIETTVEEQFALWSDRSDVLRRLCVII